MATRPPTLGRSPNVAALTLALGHRVRADVVDQGLTTTEKANARGKIDAVGFAQLGQPDTNFVATFVAGLT